MCVGRLTPGDSYTPGGVNRPVHILLLSDRDWTHPQGGGTGTNLSARSRAGSRGAIA